MKKNKYCVIGGQYEDYWYGDTPTLLGAKRLANKHWEYWDNWQGWNRPGVYNIEDTELIITHGWITNADGKETRVRKPRAEPICW